MALALTAELPPLTQDEDGSIRIGRSRVTLDVVINAQQHWGWSAERIAAEYETLNLADVYAALGYYLRHKDEVDAYLARREAEAEALKATILASQKPFPTKTELLARRAARERDGS
jgi:uncharacterized protein (DUF433 family)